MGALVLALAPAVASGQYTADRPRVLAARTRAETTSLDTVEARGRPLRRFASRSDSVEWAIARRRANDARGFRLVISVYDRRLWAIIDDDTVLVASVAVGKDSTFDYQGKRWLFRTPRGRYVVARKDSLPTWVPPDWHYFEVARERGLVVRYLVEGRPVALDDGGRLEIRRGVVGVVGRDSVFSPLPEGDEIIFDGFLFVPPVGTKHRQIEGELGRYRLGFGDGYALHGTPDQESVGEAATHGCIRLRESDIAWLYELVPVGTPVFIY